MTFGARIRGDLVFGCCLVPRHHWRFWQEIVASWHDRENLKAFVHKMTNGGLILIVLCQAVSVLGHQMAVWKWVEQNRQWWLDCCSGQQLSRPRAGGADQTSRLCPVSSAAQPHCDHTSSDKSTIFPSGECRVTVWRGALSAVSGVVLLVLLHSSAANQQILPHTGQQGHTIILPEQSDTSIFHVQRHKNYYNGSFGTLKSS